MFALASKTSISPSGLMWQSIPKYSRSNLRLISLTLDASRGRTSVSNRWQRSHALPSVSRVSMKGMAIARGFPVTVKQRIAQDRLTVEHQYIDTGDTGPHHL